MNKSQIVIVTVKTIKVDKKNTRWHNISQCSGNASLKGIDLHGGLNEVKEQDR